MSKSEERRNQILVGAFKLFLVKEYADVSLRRIWKKSSDCLEELYTIR